MLNKSDLPKFDPNIYTTIPSSQLVVYSVYYLQEHDVEITSEDIISACFTLFPKKFSLKKYPQWPDSAMVSRRWSDCRNKGYLAAKTDSGFKLTAKGFRLAGKVAKILGVATPKRVKHLQPQKPVETPAKKVLPVPVVVIPKVKQEPKVEVLPAPVVKIETPRVKQKRTTPAKKTLPVPVVKIPKVKHEPFELK
jgi:hypothetical protein